MIKLTKDIPEFLLPRAEVIKINCNREIYHDESLFWVQNEDKAIISMLDGNMVIYENGADFDELLEFINVISPTSVFSDAKTLTSLFGENFERVFVMEARGEYECDKPSDKLSSREIYEILNVEGLELPDYEYFAPDFCRRLNRGFLKYYAKKGEFAAVIISDGAHRLLNGIASNIKGGGTKALCGVLEGTNGAIAVCRKELKEFYLKNRFEHIYDAGYWRKCK